MRNGRLMGTSSGGAARASDDGALLTVINQPVIPELSLIGKRPYRLKRDKKERRAQLRDTNHTSHNHPDKKSKDGYLKSTTHPPYITGF